MTTLRETFAADFEEEEKAEWMEAYLKSKGLLNLAKVAMMDEPELGISNKKRVIPEVHSQHRIQDPTPQPAGYGFVIGKMLKHNQEAKKKKLIKNVKRSERHEWTGAYKSK
jgi:hypothetical protein